MPTDTCMTIANPAHPRFSLNGFLARIAALAPGRHARIAVETASRRQVASASGVADAAFLQSLGANRWTPREG